MKERELQMTNLALEVETKQISNYAAYDASIEVDWTIPFTDKSKSGKLVLQGFTAVMTKTKKHSERAYLKHMTQL